MPAAAPRPAAAAAAAAAAARAAARADTLEGRVQALDRTVSLAVIVVVFCMNADVLAHVSPRHAAALLSGGGVFALAAWLLPRRTYLRARSAIALVMPLVACESAPSSSPLQLKREGEAVRKPNARPSRRSARLAASAPHLRDAAFTPPRLRGGAGCAPLDVWRVLGGTRVLHAFFLQLFAPVGLSLGAARFAALSALTRSPAACASPLAAARAPWFDALHAAFGHLAGGGPPPAPAAAGARCEAAVLFAQAAAGLILAPAVLVRLKHPAIELAALRGGRLARVDALLEALLGASPLGPAHAAFSAYAALAWLYLSSLLIHSPAG
jgi:hypothetical protein